MALEQTRYQTLSDELFSVYHSLPRYAGQNLDRCVRAHEPKTKLLENKDSVGAVKQERDLKRAIERAKS